LLTALNHQFSINNSLASRFVMTSGTFTQDATEFASGRNVRLIAGDELRELVREARGAKPSPTVAANTAAAPSTSTAGCPVCGSPMMRRQAKRGANAGGHFYGCSRYPACKGTRAA
jgi:restriction system protein